MEEQLRVEGNQNGREEGTNGVLEKIQFHVSKVRNKDIKIDIALSHFERKANIATNWVRSILL